jgi:antitoxin component of RelBE/YafQ-DinJ toxin-antitoxin module
MKESGIRIRVDADVKQNFIDACKSNDVTVSQVLRAFMRDYIELNKNPIQKKLFDEVSSFNSQ